MRKVNRKLGFFILVVAMAASVLAADRVSVVNLISSPEAYHDKEVIVGGFLSLDEEGSALYLHKDDYVHLLANNGLWCSIDVVTNKSFNHAYVYLEGKFDSNGRGHMGLFSGEIKNIKRVWMAPSQRGNK